MTRFLLVILLYFGMQAYVMGKAAHAFGGWPGGKWTVAAAALCMTLAPFLLWRLERCEACHALAVTGAWIVYAWMGLSFLFFWLGLAADGYGLLARLAGLPRPDAARQFLLTGAIAAALFAYGLHAAWHPRIQQVVIRSAKLPAGTPPLRIVQISDVHLGVLIGRLRLRGIMEEVRALRPDVLVSTGDLVDAQAHHLDGLSGLIAAVPAPLGKYAVTGNHERYVGMGLSLDFNRRAGLHTLRGSHAAVGPHVVLAGVDDPGRLGSATHEAGVLAALPRERFVILLKHQPVVDLAARFDLQLSGHTHNGQIFPFGYLVRQVYPMPAGLNPLPDGRLLYVSRGTGTWGPPIRILSPPEITLIELGPAQQGTDRAQ